MFFSKFKADFLYQPVFVTVPAAAESLGEGVPSTSTMDDVSADILLVKKMCEMLAADV